MKNENSFSRLLPVLFGFFIMGFVDVVGIATNYIKQDFSLSDSLANLLPMMVFLWFGVFAVPTGLLMNSIGRKKTVVLSMAVTFVAMLVPLIAYRFEVVLVAFALLGIGNTILQVSLNPLLSNVVRGDRLTSSLTWGQFIKAIASFLGPVIAGFAAAGLHNWKMLFPIFAAVTLLSTLWLLLTPIDEKPVEGKTSSFAACFIDILVEVVHLFPSPTAFVSRLKHFPVFRICRKDRVRHLLFLLVVFVFSTLLILSSEPAA